jgi:hypothetical protein
VIAKLPHSQVFCGDILFAAAEHITNGDIWPASSSLHLESIWNTNMSLQLIAIR